MDDFNFNDDKVALDWIKAIESVKVGKRDQDIYPMVRNWIEHHHPHQILEIGSGQGACSEKINLENRQYTGLEPFEIMVTRALELYPEANKKFINGNVYSMPLPDLFFDAAFSILVWHLLSDLKTAAAELSRVLKPHGHFLIVTANPDNYQAWKDLYLELSLDGKRLEGRTTDSTDILYLHTLDEIQTSLQIENLKIQKTEVFRNETFILIQGQKI
jgi:ubiquinone/menaquinone biosynthesis C-methylase UbiE